MKATGMPCPTHIYQIPTMRPLVRPKSGIPEAGICTSTSIKPQADWPDGQTACELTTHAGVSTLGVSESCLL